jgi:hypothetical protein
VILCHGFRATKASPYHPWETFAFKYIRLD